MSGRGDAKDERWPARASVAIVPLGLALAVAVNAFGFVGAGLLAATFSPAARAA